MNVSLDPIALQKTEPLRVERPVVRTTPAIFASPHSGRCYSSEFLAAARLDPLNLRRQLFSMH